MNTIPRRSTVLITAVAHTLSLSDLGVTRREGRLRNGMRVVHFEKPCAPVVLRMSFLSGGQFDPTGKGGIAHFVEHMLLAGTTSYPTKDKLSMSIENVGGGIGASTGPDILTVNVSVSEPADTILALRLLNEVTTQPLFDDHAIETERGSILREIGMTVSSLGKIAGKAWHELIFQGTPLERRVIGTEESVKALSKADLLAFYRDHITADRATIVSSGGISFDDLMALLESSLKLQPAEHAFKLDTTPVSYVDGPKVRSLENTFSDQSFIITGVRTVPIFHADVPVLDLIGNTVGGGRSSLLMQKLRYARGLVYGADVSHYNSVNAGEWSIHTQTSAENVAEVLAGIEEIMADIRERGLPAEVIAAKKEQYRKSLRSRFQTPTDWVGRHSYAESVGIAGETILDWADEYAAVTNEDIIRVARTYFAPERWHKVVVGK